MPRTTRTIAFSLPPEMAEQADNRILVCAVAASAGYLITGDRRHLLAIGEQQGTRLINAPRFLSEVGQVR